MAGVNCCLVSGRDADDYFGESVAISYDGNTIVAGATNEAGSSSGIGGNKNNNEALHAGAVYVFTTETDDWKPTSYVKSSFTDYMEDGGFYGPVLSSSGSILGIGGESRGHMY